LQQNKRIAKHLQAVIHIRLLQCPEIQTLILHVICRCKHFSRKFICERF